MDKATPIYDESIEKQLNALILRLDEKPHIKTNPVEESSYMGFTLADSEKGFLKYIKENFYDKFLTYLDSYKNDCINAYAIRTNFIPVIKRLLSQYEGTANSHYESQTRDEWSQYFHEPLVSDTEHIEKKQAYQFFYNASAVQIFFLGKLAEKMKAYMAEFESAIPKPEPEYYFSILPEFTTQRHFILYDIHKNLMAEGYINCTPDAFKNVFTNKEPEPIKWLKSQRSLTYMIKLLTEQFLVKKEKPSNYYIAERYIHIYKNGNFFHPKRPRHDDNPKKVETEFLDKVIDDAIRAYK
ncbi:MAG: hypothetical protein WCS03_10765 [Bacteroidota bacterium]